MEKMTMMMEPIKSLNPKCSANSSVDHHKVGMHNDSRVISKSKPKIRIIHVFAPEIIKTDVSNFRQLVQSLTGKAAADQAENNVGRVNGGSTDHHHHHPKLIRGDQTVVKEEADDHGHDHDEEEELWKSTSGHEKISANFLDGFSDLDGFIDELSEFRTSLPLRSSRMDAFHEEYPKVL